MKAGSGLNPRADVIGRIVGGCGGLGRWHQRSWRVAKIPLLAVRDGDVTESFVFFVVRVGLQNSAELYDVQGCVYADDAYIFDDMADI